MSYFYWLCVWLFCRIRLPKDQGGRSHSYSPIFGIHCAPDCEGSIKIGDPVYLSCWLVLTLKCHYPPNFFLLHKIFLYCPGFFLQMLCPFKARKLGGCFFGPWMTIQENGCSLLCDLIFTLKRYNIWRKNPGLKKFFAKEIKIYFGGKMFCV